MSIYLKSDQRWDLAFKYVTKNALLNTRSLNLLFLSTEEKWRINGLEDSENPIWRPNPRINLQKKAALHEHCSAAL
jgi:hypothetical protein